MIDHGLIGNCQALALVRRDGIVTWACLPRPDSPPVFGRLLDEDGGEFAISPLAAARSECRYRPNTAILETTHETADGERFSVTDFYPRFEQHGRTYRPLQLVRIVRPLVGMPVVSVRCRPVVGWTKERARQQRGNSHIRYDGYDGALRLTTDLPLTYLMDERPTPLTRPLYFVLSWDVPMEADLAETCELFLTRTENHWRTWVKRCSLPSSWQAEVVRSAITLKLHCFEETGAVLAAPTTSLPEIVGASRNWDYRYCWLRDAWFTVSALCRLGHFDDLEGLLGFLLNVVREGDVLDTGLKAAHGRLHPVYRLDGTLPLPELSHAAWRGVGGSQPVRSGNDAASHVQNDIYGEMLLSLSTLFRDERLIHLRTDHWERLLGRLAERCYQVLGEPDAGLWELRGGWRPHAFSALLSWAGIHAYARLAASGRVHADVTLWQSRLAEAEAELRRSVVDGALRSAPGSRDADASLALLAILGFPDAALCDGTLRVIIDQLSLRVDGKDSGFYFRYRHADDFGVPDHAFVVCSFWVAEALARRGDLAGGARVFADALTAANPLGLIAEHFDPRTGQPTGNFPQCYSHVGLIAAAFAVSPESPLIG
ncbi:MAG: glycoside hydrolase family 15 protein [Myxococcales bacterium]|nr:glycoside hydrolase family 15 protein [Myxococcales bacterium]